MRADLCSFLQKKMAINTFRRYIWLLETQERLEYATFGEIQEAWKHSPINTGNEDLPKRTFRNHITAIGEQMKIYIDYKPGHGYYIANPEDLRESHIKQWIISSLSVYNLLSEFKDLKSHILIEEIPSCEAFLTPIAHAIRRGYVLTFVYQSNQNPAPHRVEVETCEEYSIFTLYLSPTWDFKQELLSRADQLEVLAPASLREWMGEMIRKMMGRYE